MFSFLANGNAENKSFFDFSINLIDGKKIELSEFKGKSILLVNVASNCGFTKQYSDLQKLYDIYQSQGLIVLGVPSNQFGGQEPDNEKNIKDFCETNFNISFPMTICWKFLDKHVIQSLFRSIHSAAKRVDSSQGCLFVLWRG